MDENPYEPPRQRQPQSNANRKRMVLGMFGVLLIGVIVVQFTFAVLERRNSDASESDDLRIRIIDIESDSWDVYIHDGSDAEGN